MSLPISVLLPPHALIVSDEFWRHPRVLNDFPPLAQTSCSVEPVAVRFIIPTYYYYYYYRTSSAIIPTEVQWTFDWILRTKANNNNKKAHIFQDVSRKQK